MSRPVGLRYRGAPIQARLAFRGGKALLEVAGKSIEAAVTRDGPWIEMTSADRRVRAAAARDARGIWVALEGRLYLFEVEHRHAGAAAEEGSSGEVRAPMTGRVASVEARRGDQVREGDILLSIEAMKMEFKVTAPADGMVVEMSCAAGDQVDLGQVLARVAAPEGSPP